MNKTYVVAGGANGIGGALVTSLATKSARVFVIDIFPPVKTTKNVTYIKADLSKSSEVSRAASELPPKIDVIILSVGVMRRGKIFESSEDDYDLVMNTNVKAIWLLLKELAPKLKPGALILQMSSGHVLNPETDPALYTLSKMAVTNLIQMVARTNLDMSVKIVYPGPVLTDLLVQGRSHEDIERISKIAQSPEDIAAAICTFLDSKHKSLVFNHTTWSYHTED